MSVEQLKFKKLVKELSFLKSDLEYHTAEHKERREIFYKDLEEFLNNSDFQYSEEKTEQKMVDVYKTNTNKNNTSNPEPSIQNSTELDIDPLLDNQNKEMFKKIAKKTHPDTHSDEDKTMMFLKASDAIRNNDWYTLYDLSMVLGLELPEGSIEHIKWMEKEKNNISNVLKKITNTYEWIYSEPKANKQLIMTNYCVLTCTKK